jgi:hypothetical protein
VGACEKGLVLPSFFLSTPVCQLPADLRAHETRSIASEMLDDDCVADPFGVCRNFDPGEVGRVPRRPNMATIAHTLPDGPEFMALRESAAMRIGVSVAVASRSTFCRGEPMLRLIAFAAFTVCLATSVAVAGESTKLLIIAKDRHTASALSPLPENAELAVLIEDVKASFESVNSRALKMRYAMSFVSVNGFGSPWSAIFRERLQNHGAIAIDLRCGSPASRVDRVDCSHPVAPPFTSLLEKH